MDFVKIINDILEKNTPEEIREYLYKLKITVSKEEFIKVCDNKSNDIAIKINNYIIQNGEEIIKIFNLIRKTKDEFLLSKKSFDTMKNQMIILKKKYIEPYEKLNKSISEKSNIETVKKLFELAKNFKEDVKILKTHYEKNTLLLSAKNFDVYLRLKKFNLTQLSGIIFIKEEYDWFLSNDENIMNKYRSLFEKSVMNKSNDELIKFFELYSGLNILVTEIKNFSNKILKKLMVEIFLEKIIRQNINNIPISELNYANISKIRKDIINFFDMLDSYNDVFNNLGKLLKSSFDIKNFVLYENVMEAVSIYSFIKYN